MLVSERYELAERALIAFSKKLGIEAPFLESVMMVGGTAGSFSPRDYTIFIDLYKVRTARDIVFIIGHEVAHAMQFVNRFRNARSFLRQAEKEVVKLGYFESPLEKEADEIGFSLERDFKYKNVVIAKYFPSLFIGRKMLRNNPVII